MKDVVIFSAADAKYFRMGLGLVLSLLRSSPTRPRIRILDLGLTSAQIETLTPLVEAILPPRWYSGSPRSFPQGMLGMLARPYLPRYAEDAEIILWLDADAWVQQWSAIAALIEAARPGRMAIVEEGGGPGVEIRFRGPDGQMQLFRVAAEDVRRNVTACYRLCFGEEAAAKYGGMPNYNGGAWALRRDSPSWAVYGEHIELGLSRFVHPLTEQQGLNIAIRTGRIEVAPMPIICNYNMNQGLPGYDTRSHRFVVPDPPHEAIGVLHFTDLKNFTQLSLPRLPQGGEVLVPFHFLDWLSFAGP